jgi:hypothetical protein
VAIEVQISSLSLETITERTIEYHRKGIHVLWLLAEDGAWSLAVEPRVKENSIFGDFSPFHNISWTLTSSPYLLIGIEFYRAGHGFPEKLRKCRKKCRKLVHD